MYSSETKIRVRYSETDQMGYVYYGNYAAFYEVGRSEALRELGISYDEMEKKGVIMPVINMNITYFKPAKYDDLLTIKTTVKEIPKTRMQFSYQIYNQMGILLNEGETTLVFISIKKNRPVNCPKWLEEMLMKNL